MLRIALTGGIATGKSYVLEQFRTRGVPCLDADVLAHGVLSAGTEATAEVARQFGPEFLAADGSVDRVKLGSHVFANADARQALESIVHPPVYRAIEVGLRAFALLGDYSLAVVDIPLLFETGHAADFDRVIVTTCSSERQMARLTERGVSEVDARQRIAAQLPTADKASRADFVVTTDGTFEETDRQIEALMRQLYSPR